MQSYVYLVKNLRFRLEKTHFGVSFLDIIKVQGVGESAFLEFLIWLINIKLLLLQLRYYNNLLIYEFENSCTCKAGTRHTKCR